MENHQKQSASVSPSVADLLIPSEVQYFRISRAAEMLGCTPDDLLHIGALGKISLVAPILAKGRFMWPTDQDRFGLIGFDSPAVYEFGPADRVILPPSTLSVIEAVGYAIPTRFYAPDVARKEFSAQSRVIGPLTEEGGSDGDAELGQDGGQDPRGSAVDDGIPNLFSPFFQAQLREAAINGVWEAIDELDDDPPKTKIEHLFVPASEISRISEGRPLPKAAVLRLGKDVASPAKPTHGNTEVHSKKQLEVLKFGLWLFREQIKEVVGDSTKWAAEIDQQAAKRWDDRIPPLTTSVIEKHLRTIFQDNPRKLLAGD